MGLFCPVSLCWFADEVLSCLICLKLYSGEDAVVMVLRRLTAYLDLQFLPYVLKCKCSFVEEWRTEALKSIEHGYQMRESP